MHVTFTERKKRAVAKWEKKIITEALDKTQGHIKQAASDLHIEYNHLCRLIYQYDLKPKDFRHIE